MARDDLWSASEVNDLLDAAVGGLPSVLRVCPQRSREVLERFTLDLHRLHRGQPPRRLSRQTRLHVEARRGQLVCPRCAEAF
jgi:hypothetical protein